MAERYSRQEILKKIGKSGQKKLGKSTVAILGLGAIGTVAAELLTRAGIGNLILIDRDIIELNNLQRQSLFEESDVGKPKATTAAGKLRRINSEITITAENQDADNRNIGRVIGRPDCILDCTDNMETRFLLNEYCSMQKIPWIHAAAIKNYCTVFPVIPGKACFSCVFRYTNKLETCDTAGILNSVSTVAAAMQANEALKILIGKPDSRLYHFDIWQGKFHSVAIKKIPCDVCNGKYSLLNRSFSASRPVKLCGNGYYQIRGGGVSLKLLHKKLGKIGTVKNHDECIQFRQLTIFSDGRALIKASSKEEARSLYSRLVGN